MGKAWMPQRTKEKEHLLHLECKFGKNMLWKEVGNLLCNSPQVMDAVFSAIELGSVMGKPDTVQCERTSNARSRYMCVCVFQSYQQSMNGGSGA